MRIRFLVFAGVMLVLSVVVCVESAGLVIWTPLGPGPGFFTFILGVALACLAMGVAWEERKRATAGGVGDDSPDLDDDVERGPEPMVVTKSILATPTPLPVAGRPGGTRKLILVSAALVCIPFILEPLGFRLSAFALLAYLLIYVERRRWWTSLILAAVTSIGSYYVFYDLLSVPLPLGLLGF